MSLTVGGDLNDLAQLATTLRESGRQVGEIKAGLDRVVQSTSWTGPAASRFRADWQQFAPTLVRLHDALSDGAAEVDRRRDAIDRATS
jgi:WXG100 family type VII secretion target